MTCCVHYVYRRLYGNFKQSSFQMTNNNNNNDEPRNGRIRHRHNVQRHTDPFFAQRNEQNFFEDVSQKRKRYRFYNRARDGDCGYSACTNSQTNCNFHDFSQIGPSSNNQDDHSIYIHSCPTNLFGVPSSCPGPSSVSTSSADHSKMDSRMNKFVKQTSKSSSNCAKRKTSLFSYCAVNKDENATRYKQVSLDNSCTSSANANTNTKDPPEPSCTPKFSNHASGSDRQCPTLTGRHYQHFSSKTQDLRTFECSKAFRIVE